MPALEDYIVSMEALAPEVNGASGLAVLAAAVAGTGTCGVTTAGQGLALPLPVLAAAGEWRPLAVAALPLPEALAATVLWHPAWGATALPVPDTSGQAAPALEVSLALTPLFSLSRTAGLGRVDLPLPAVAARYDANRTGKAACLLPETVATGYACGLVNPVTDGAGSNAVVGLLCQGDAELAALAAVWAGDAVGNDALAARLLAAVAGMVSYVADPDGADVWTCALGTSARGCGDCEDGAILLHGVLLAAGLPADRLVTAFGRVGLDKTGHAWVAYRRESDGVWVGLDWTFGSGQGPVSGLPVMGESAYYALVDDALTASAFFTVRQDVAVFFARSRADALVLPAPTLDAAASLGGHAVAALPDGWLTCAAGCGVGVQCRLASPGLAAVAGSVWARVGWSALALAAVPGATGAVAACAPEVVANGAGSGQGRARLIRLRGRGEASSRSLGGANLVLRAWRGLAWGLAGALGRGGCRLHRPAMRGHGLGGALAAGQVLATTPVCRGSVAPPALTVALSLAAASLAARGAVAPGEAQAPFVFDHAAGEEWL